MTILLGFSALTLLVSILIGLHRVFRSRHAEPLGNVLLAIQLLGTAGVALIMVLAALLSLPALLDVALVLALLATIAAVAFTRQQNGKEADKS